MQSPYPIEQIEAKRSADRIMVTFTFDVRSPEGREFVKAIIDLGGGTSSKNVQMHMCTLESDKALELLERFKDKGFFDEARAQEIKTNIETNTNISLGNTRRAVMPQHDAPGDLGDK